MTSPQPGSSVRWNPWSTIPVQYNLGTDLTTAQVQRGRGRQTAIFWENAAGATRMLTYAQLDDLSDRFARSLAYLGVQRGDRVFLRLPNIPEFYIAALGVAKAGGVFIPSSTQFRTSEVKYRLQDSGAVAAVVTPQLLSEIEESAGECPELEHVIVVPYPNAEEAVSKNHVNMQSLLQDEAPGGRKDWAPAETRHDDVAFIAYTSGTTGDPKGVVHYQRYPRAYDPLIRVWHDYRPGDVVACPSELGWLLPVACTFLYSLRSGLSTVLYDGMGGKFDPLAWLGLFQKYHITNFTATPTTYRMLMAAAEEGVPLTAPAFRHAVTAGEPCPEDTIRGIQRHFGVTPLDGIGMSECMVYCCNSIGEEVRPGSCGRPTPGTEIELLDADLQPVADGEEGVLAVRRNSHPGMMKEYWNKPTQTAEIFQGEWYLSGDVLVRDEDGFFWFKGRADDVIKASGYRVSPFEVESCLCCHPAVLEAAAVAAPDPLRGAVIKAFVVVRPGTVPDPALATQIQEFAKQHVAPYKYPRQIEFVDALPKTTSGKIRRKVLRGQ